MQRERASARRGSSAFPSHHTASRLKRRVFGEQKRHLRCTNERAQERRASARRGCLTPVQSRKFTNRSARVFGEQKRHLRCTNERAQERRASARRGSDSRLRTDASRSKVYHGGLTPTAPGWLTPGATCVRRAKATFAMHKRTCTRAAGVSPPWVEFALSHRRSWWRASSAGASSGVLTNT
jgi:hypothetical protein